MFTPPLAFQEDDEDDPSQHQQGDLVGNYKALTIKFPVCTVPSRSSVPRFPKPNHGLPQYSGV